MDAGIYFGRPSQLRRLYDPFGGMLATIDIGSSVFVSGDGSGTNISKALGGARTYTLNYGVLGRANFEFLNAFQLGHMGTGPFVLLDPGRRNLLTGNQSSATSLTNDTRGFTVSGAGGSISSDSSLTTLFPRSLKWSFATATPASASLLLDKPSSVWPGIPVTARPYTFWFWVLGGTGAINFQLTLKWMSLTGSTLSTSTSATYTSSTSNWLLAKLSVVSVPVGAVWVQPGIAPDVSTIGSGEALYINSLQLNEGDGPDASWAPGTGVYPVQMLTLPERYGFAEPGMLVSPTLTLQELR